MLSWITLPRLSLFGNPADPDTVTKVLRTGFLENLFSDDTLASPKTVGIINRTVSVFGGPVQQSTKEHTWGGASIG